MLTVIGCFVGEHNPWLVALAALVCALASATAMELLTHAGRAGGRGRYTWLAVAAAAGGSGIWATHFLAMLAYAPGLPSGYGIGLTLLSYADAVAITGLGFALATMGGRVRAAIGGAVVGGGIAAMHYTGMAAYQVPGHLIWNPAVVAVSVAVGAVLGAMALVAGLSAGSIRGRGLGAGLLILAICGHHFTGMGAVTVQPDPTVAIPDSAIRTEWLAAAVALASSLILLLAGAALLIDLRERRRAESERERLRSLANAAVEGLVVCHGGRIVSANEAFARLAGTEAASLVGAGLSTYLPGLAATAGTAGEAVEAELVPAAGGTIPVEVILRPMAEYGRQPHHAVAVRDLRARRRAESQIHYLAHHDALTGLANRTSFQARLEREMRAADVQRTRLAVLCLDLDRFKEVNDLFGHAAGDAMLRDLALRVGGLLEPTQLMARLGGDEFAILTPLGHGSADGSAERLAERILAMLAAVPAASGPVIATSIGIAVYPDDAPDQRALLSHADAALYRAKAEGRGTCRRYDASMGAQIRDRRMLEHDLRHAVSRGELDLVYQPQTRIETGAVMGFEALLRWRHPERGPVSPALFVPIAEETGAILEIGAWVLREACRTAALWPQPLAIAVNVSAVQLHNPHFVQFVHGTLFESGLKAERLEIEITETALIRDPARALLTLRQLKALGVRIAMDDFGTGYSSLSNLRSFPFDRIKIDGSFIKAVHSNPQGAAIVRSVLGLGRGLGLAVVAEGVETDDELSFLVAEHCTIAQGYLLGRPSPIATFAAYTHGDAPDPVAAVA
ncbi:MULTISPECIES: EAL domain-containing protein [unclassified Methylobacterium]|jgi:diguanylate cyclase (GGDEF)-like protein/PAS domain S-box-containing protein|uniref:EAL domain-containing protein n=1 Tax=unclassified Methylobacterium TaxID=2615210 RepID=UPI0013528AB4|nr:EAL domain-containing protein [Methylobacterium sp. 2A]MWV24736.1 EAL domain-containing protein [Methylobacterium sp. 2A]